MIRTRGIQHPRRRDASAVEAVPPNRKRTGPDPTKAAARLALVPGVGQATWRLHHRESSVGKGTRSPCPSRLDRPTCRPDRSEEPQPRLGRRGIGAGPYVEECIARLPAEGQARQRREGERAFKGSDSKMPLSPCLLSPCLLVSFTTGPIAHGRRQRRDGRQYVGRLPHRATSRRGRAGRRGGASAAGRERPPDLRPPDRCDDASARMGSRLPPELRAIPPLTHTGHHAVGLRGGEESRVRGPGGRGRRLPLGEAVAVAVELLARATAHTGMLAPAQRPANRCGLARSGPRMALTDRPYGGVAVGPANRQRLALPTRRRRCSVAARFQPGTQRKQGFARCPSTPMT